MNVEWTDAAVQHLLGIYEYIAQDSPVYALRVVDRLTRQSELIGRFPRSGRMVPEYGAQDIREVISKPYRIIYRVKPNQIDVLAVIHGARILTPEDELTEE